MDNSFLSFLFVLIAFAIYIFMVVATVKIAGGKGRSGGLWGILAVFFPLIALIIVAVLPPKSVV